MGENVHAAPAKHDVLQTPPGTSTVALFACVQSTIDKFRQTSRFWPPVSVNDPARGIFETGDYDAANVGGFRVRIKFSEADGRASVDLKGAGPYFMDLGVDQAMSDLTASVRGCLQPKE